MGMLRALFKRWQCRAIGCNQRLALIPIVIDVCDQTTRVDAIERRHDHLHVGQKSLHLGCLRQRHTRHALQCGKNKKVQAHADDEREARNEREQLRGRVIALEYGRTLGP